jgi:Flp pilus assembly protein TadD
MVTPSQTPDADRAWELAALTDSLVPQQWRAYEHVNGLLYVGGVLARAGESDSARSVLAQARALVTPEIDPENSLLSDEAYVLILLADYDGAVDLLKRYVAANPGHFEDASSLSWWWRPLQGHPGFQELVGGR